MLILSYNECSLNISESEVIMAFSIDDLAETLGLHEISEEEKIIDEDEFPDNYDDEFSDSYEDRMEEEFEEMMMGQKKGLLEEIYVVTSGIPSERKMIIFSGGMSFIYHDRQNLSFRLFDSEAESLFTMEYYWNDMIEK